MLYDWFGRSLISTEFMRILIVEDDRTLRIQLRTELERTSGSKSNFQIVPASNLNEAQDLLQAQAFDIAFVDLNLGEGGDNAGVQLLEKIRASYPDIVTIITTGNEDSAVIEECLRLGAADYIIKPFDPSMVHRLMIKAKVHHRLFRANQILRAQGGYPRESILLTTKSPAFREVLNKAEKLRGKSIRVLITGESGTGKEVLAKYISSFEDDSRPFVPVHCGGISEHLVESTLFGHTKGAFTGATEDKAGLFEVADGGDIFLDEIGTMPLEVQIKVLRTLNSGEVIRVGAVSGRKFNFRVIAATNEDLQTLVTKKMFRDDLYYRINEVELKLPSLRERKEDISDLIQGFFMKFGKPNKYFTAEALDFSLNYPWPGNIRQLEKVVKVLAELTDGNEISRKALEVQLNINSAMKTSNPSINPKSVFSIPTAHIAGRFQANLEELEQAMVRFAMDETINDTQAAKYLGIPRNSLVRRLQEWGWKNSENSSL